MFWVIWEMKKRKIGLVYKGKKIVLDCKVCSGFCKFWGLMFSRRQNQDVLVFEFSENTRMPIHSWFVFYPFVAVWLNSEGKVIEKKIVGPFEFSIKPSEEYKILIEIPFNKKNSDAVKLLVGS